MMQLPQPPQKILLLILGNFHTLMLSNCIKEGRFERPTCVYSI